MNFRNCDMAEFSRKRIDEYLNDDILHRRFESKEDIVKTLLKERYIVEARINDDDVDVDFGDDVLIGGVKYFHKVNGRSYQSNYDINLWYIKDNLGKMYITEVAVLDLVDEEYNL